MIRHAFLLLFALLAFEIHAQTAIEECTNGIDDDGDGLIDCADLKCFGIGACSSESANFNCSDGIDNDGDGKVDCEDEECDCALVEICNNRLDDDGDGLVDCADTVGVGSNCISFVGCERDCNNGIDDDGDGFVDYFDGDCSASPRQTDSLALVALYHATDGDNWTKNDHWLTGSLNNWFGVTLNKGRVSSLRLEENGLNGELPVEINNLNGMHTFDFSDNNIHSIPSGFLDDAPQASGWMGGTQLTFEDLLIQSRFFAKLYDQQLVGKDTTVTLEKGENYIIRLHIDPEVTTSQYVWFRDKVAFDTTSVNYYTIADITEDDVGTYTCEVTNSESIIDLTLRSHPTVIQVQDDRQPRYVLSGQIWQQPNIPYVGKAYAVLYEADRNLGRNFRTQELPEDNIYHFDSLEAGKYTFLVSLYSTQYVPTYWGGHYLLSEAQTIQLQQDTTLNLTLLPTPVSPTRAWSSIRGRLVGPSDTDNGRSMEVNNALAEVSIYLRDAETGELLARAVTDETGAFAFTELPPRTYTLAIDYQGLPTQENTVTVGDHQEATVLATVTDEIAVTVEDEVVTALTERGETTIVRTFPNPVTDQLRVETTGASWIGATVTLQNVLGNTVAEAIMQEARTTLDMSNQKAGIYLLTVRKGGILKIQKIVKR